MERKHPVRALRLGIGLLLIPILVAGCFQSAGSGFEQPNFDTQPTFTPFTTPIAALPTETPASVLEDLPIAIVTETPTQIVFPTQAPTQAPIIPTQAEVVPTQVAIVPTQVVLATNPPIEPTSNLQALDLLTPAPTEIAFQITQVTPDGAQPQLNAFEITATYIVGQATLQAALPITQTAAAVFGQPTATIAIGATAIPGLPTATPGGVVVSGADCIHEVQQTDPNLYRIALRYGVTVEAIAAASGVTNVNLIYVGQQLVIPGCGTTGVIPPATSIPTTTSGQVVGGSGTVSSGNVHVVAQGETLFELSLQYGVPVASIASANGISDINLIYIGQELVIP